MKQRFLLVVLLNMLLIVLVYGQEICHDEKAFINESRNFVVNYCEAPFFVVPGGLPYEAGLSNCVTRDAPEVGNICDYDESISYINCNGLNVGSTISDCGVVAGCGHNRIAIDFGDANITGGELQNIVATHTGKCIRLPYSCGPGYWVAQLIAESGNQKLFALYMHLDGASINAMIPESYDISDGVLIHKGQFIALEGNSGGDCFTSIGDYIPAYTAHIHYEWRIGLLSSDPTVWPVFENSQYGVFTPRNPFTYISENTYDGVGDEVWLSKDRVCAGEIVTFYSATSKDWYIVQTGEQVGFNQTELTLQVNETVTLKATDAESYYLTVYVTESDQIDPYEGAWSYANPEQLDKAAIAHYEWQSDYVWGDGGQAVLFDDFADTTEVFVTATDVHGCESVGSYVVSPENSGSADLVVSANTVNYSEEIWEIGFRIWNRGGLPSTETIVAVYFILDYSYWNRVVIPQTASIVPVLNEGEELVYQYFIPQSQVPNGATNFIVVVEELADGESNNDNNSTDELWEQNINFFSDVDLSVTYLGHIVDNQLSTRKVFAEVNVANLGVGASMETVGFAVYHSMDSILSNDDLLVTWGHPANSGPISPLSSGQNYNATIAFNPSFYEWNQAGYWIIEIDPTGRIPREVDRSNNVVVFAKNTSEFFADYIALSIESSEIVDTLHAGQTYEFDLLIGNNGTLKAKKSDMGIFLSRDTVWDKGDIFLKRVEIGNLAWLTDYNYNGEEVYIPESPFEKVYVLLVMDVDNDISEVDEVNNVAFCEFIGEGEGDVILSSEAVSVNPDLEVYPNPNSGQFFIEGGFRGDILVYDLMGRYCFQIIKNTDLISVDLPESFSPGMYVLEICDQRYLFMYKVMIKR